MGRGHGHHQGHPAESRGYTADNVDRYFDLFIAVIEQARIDLELPARDQSRQGNFPSAQEKQSAIEFIGFLESLQREEQRQ